MMFLSSENIPKETSVVTKAMQQINEKQFHFLPSIHLSILPYFLPFLHPPLSHFSLSLALFHSLLFFPLSFLSLFLLFHFFNAIWWYRLYIGDTDRLFLAMDTVPLSQSGDFLDSTYNWVWVIALITNWPSLMACLEQRKPVLEWRRYWKASRRLERFNFCGSYSLLLATASKMSCWLATHWSISLKVISLKKIYKFPFGRIMILVKT